MTSSHPFQRNVNFGCWRSGADPEMEKEGVHRVVTAAAHLVHSWLDVLYYKMVWGHAPPQKS